MQIQRLSMIMLMGSVLLACSESQAPKSFAEQQNGAENSKAKGDGPFGLHLGAKVSELNTDTDLSTPDNGFYYLQTVPSPASEFSQYAVVAFDEVGICEIRAVSDTFDSDSLGSATTAMVDDLAASLKSKYGEGEKVDFCGGGSVACEQQFWAMSIMNGERAYGYSWESPADEIRSINLSVTSDNLSRLSARLDYETGDKKKCEDALNQARAKNL